MRHRKNKLNLNRFTSWRKATLRSLSRSLLIHQSVRTTKRKAKAVRPLVDKLIGLGKKNDLASRRRAFSILQDHKLVQSLFSEIAPRYRNRNGGYCRVLPMGFRRGDGSQLAILELTERAKEEKKPVKRKEAPPKPKEEVSKPAAEREKKPPKVIKPKRKFLDGLRKIFKKERDAL
ncbi:MAG: 50S ribosomal protein L17 [Candidatus Omnitrophota bacterium]